MWMVPPKRRHFCSPLRNSATYAPGISVLTLGRGRRAHLARLIEGLCRSTTIPDELIIVDMGGPQIELPSAAFPIRVLLLKEGNLPLAQARNLAAAAAKYEMLLFLDIDCVPMAGLLGEIRATQHHDALLCAEVRYLAKDAIQDGWEEGGLLRNSITHPARSFPSAGVRRESNPGLFWSLVFAIRLDLFNDLGGFDERFTGYGAEDTDFGYRAKAAGIDLLFLGGPGAFHQHHDVFDPPLQHFRDIIRNAQIFYDRWKFWPMQSWLEAFARLDLICFDRGRIVTLRPPHASEMEMAKQVAAK